MFKSLYLLIIASALVMNNVRAAPAPADISVVGTTTMPAPTMTVTMTPLGPITPDISVVGYHTTGTVTSGGGGGATPDVSVMGAWTTTTAAVATRTECYRMVETGGVTSSVLAQATVTGGVNPPGYECFLVYATGGGTIHLPVANAPQSSPAPPNLAITVGLPIIISFIGLAAIIGAVFVFMRLRARRAAEAQRTWVDRPGGWVKDIPAAEKVEAGRY